MTTPLQRRQHARKRALERHGVVLSKKLRRQLLQMIRSNEAIETKQLTRRRTLHVLEIGGKRMTLIYSKSVRDIVTILPDNCWQLQDLPPEGENPDAPICRD